MLSFFIPRRESRSTDARVSSPGPRFFSAASSSSASIVGEFSGPTALGAWGRPLDWLVRSRLWVGVQVTLFGLVAPSVLGFDVDPRALVVLFGSTLSIYSVDDLFEAGAVGRSARWPVAATLSGIAATAFTLIGSPISTGILVGVGGLACLAYGAPLPGVGRPKDIPGIKAAWVAGAVTVAVILVPWTYHSTVAISPGDLFGLVAFLAVVTFANVVGFDVRDLASDRRRGVPTLPSLLGTRRVRQLLFGLHGLVLIVGIALRGAGLADPTPFFAVGLFASALVVRGLVSEASTRSPLVHDLVGDGFLGALGVSAWWLAG